METLKIYDLIHYLCNTPDMPVISFKGRKSKDPVHEELSSKGIFVGDMGPGEATAVCLFEWINEKTEYQIENKYPVYAASTRRSAYEASRLIDFFKDLCEILNIYDYSQDLSILSTRLYYGVNEELISLVVGVKRLGRKRARLLVDAFGEDLRPYTAKDLQKIEGIGEKLSESIVKFAMRE
jgi:helicase